MSAYIKETTSS